MNSEYSDLLVFDFCDVVKDSEVNQSSQTDRAQLTYANLLDRWIHAADDQWIHAADRENNFFLEFHSQLKIICQEVWDFYPKLCQKEKSLRHSVEILAAFYCVSYSSLSEVESLVKSVTSHTSEKKCDRDLFHTFCWLLNIDNRCYILSDFTEESLRGRQKIVKKLIRNEIQEGKCDYVHLYYLLDCSHQLGSLKLIQELEQKLNSYDDYDLVKQRDHDLKCFNDNFYLSPLSCSISAKECVDYLNNIKNKSNKENPVDNNHFVNQLNQVLDKVIERDGTVYDRPRDPPGQRSVYIPPGDTNKESYRLSTFIKFPSDCPVNPRNLAAYGFYYTGYKDRVKCFSCGLCVENWVLGDNVSSSRWHKDTCKMMRQEDSGNIPIGQLFPNFAGPSTRPSGQMTSGSSRGTSSSTSTPNLGSAPAPAPSRSVPRGRGPSTGSTPAGALLKNIASGGNVSANAPTMRQTARPVPPPQPLNQNYARIEIATIPSVHHEQLVRSLDLRREADRLRTFDAWPPTNQTVHRADLARYGFFYLGNLDRVQCFSCGGVLRNWNYGDNVEREHRTHFPNCRMVRNVENHNIALSAGERPAVPRPIVMQEPPDPSESEQEDLRNMFPCLNPASAHMRNEESRYETYDERWPANQVRATARQISRAGFFFLGDRDRVKCWYCNGGLQNWDPDDEPWTEHAKWFPTCEFLLQRKGPDFVHRIVAMFPNLPRPNLRAPYDVPPRGRRNREPSPPPQIIDPRIEMQRTEQRITEAMTSEVAAAAVQMGFEEHQIRRVVRRKLLQGEPMYTSVIELVEDLTALSSTDSSESGEDSRESSMLVESLMQSTDVKTPGSAMETREAPGGETSGQPAASLLSRGGRFEGSSAMETEPSLPEDVSPSMEARIRELQDERKCKICLDKLADVVFVPCGHLCSCTSCAQALRKCPICRVKIEKAIRTYLS